jgi:hypothetical protein
MATLTLFIQIQGDPQVGELSVPETVTASGLYSALTAAGITVDADKLLFVDDAEAPVSRDDDVRPVGLVNGARVHVTRCHRIQVTVHYLERTLERGFAPGARVRTVKAWAVKEWTLDHKDAAEHVLQLCNSKERPASDTPLHTLVTGPTCALCFDLVPEKRVEG